MKIIHLNKAAGDLDDWMEEALSLEKLIKSHPTNERAYKRLMVIYRKQKEYKKELAVINKAIRSFEEKFNRKKPAFNKKVAALSKALLKATGLADKKGNNLYEPGELAKWRKRKVIVSKKISTTQ